MKSKRSRKRTLQKTYKAEKNADVCKRILPVHIRLDRRDERVGSGKAAEDARSLGPQMGQAIRGKGAWPGSKTCPEAAGRPRCILA